MASLNDTFNLLDNDLNNQVFYTKGADWQVWQKPSNAKMVSLVVIGGGGGGGSGQSGTSSSTRRAGAGGGSSAVSIGFFSASQIPDTLFVQVGPGGIGGSGTTGSNGSSGSLSYISVQSNTTPINILMQSGNAAAGGGNSGANSGTAGIAGTAWTGGILNDMGLATSTIGQAGASGPAGAIGNNITIIGITTGGASGGGAAVGGAVFSGGSIIGTGFIPTITGGVSNINANGGDGSGGFVSLNPSIKTSTSLPLFFTGGAGGGASNNNTGGFGGAGGYGSGGGGGGIGLTSNSGGGGRGGDGIVIITCY